jgi:hypothetical protein
VLPGRIFLLASLIAAAIPEKTAANCEAGGYAIHTIAQYKKPDPKRVFLLYRREESGKILAQTAATEEALTAIAGPLRMDSGTTSCTTISSGIWLDSKFVPGDPYSAEHPYHFSLEECDALREQIPGTGYLLLDTVAKAIRFPREMHVDESPAPAAERKKIADFVRQDLGNRVLYLFTYGREAYSRIEPGVIDGSRAEVTTIGRGDHRLVVHVELLRLTVRSALIGEHRATDAQTQREEDLRYGIASGKADFPVLYFKHPSRRDPMFIGDGSLCSYVQYQRYPEPQAGAEGSFDRFRITRAFDFDLDGTADLIEVNDRFAYWLDASGVPEVIHYGLGC